MLEIIKDFINNLKPVLKFEERVFYNGREVDPNSERGKEVKRELNGMKEKMKTFFRKE